jgi:RNA polymerase sigma factor (sigma-70 family)
MPVCADGLNLNFGPGMPRNLDLRQELGKSLKKRYGCHLRKGIYSKTGDRSVMSLALRVTHAAETCSEHDLVAAVRRGDDRAFEELYARYAARIHTYIRGFVNDHARAEDIVQEVFISALRRLRQTERPIHFKPWIYEIAKNACIDDFRRVKRAKEVPLDPEPGAGEFVSLHALGPSPEGAIESKQRLTDLRGAFRGLSESHHRILVLRELEGLSYNQIGDRMGMTKPVVESTLFRARRRLGEEFEELESGRRCAKVQTVIDCCEQRPIRSLGLRERRQVVRHLSHCEACQRQARMAGIDESSYRAVSFAAKVALLPLPWLGRGAAEGGNPSLAGSVNSAVGCLDPAQASHGVGRIVAAIALIAAGAGTGGGLVAGPLSGGGNAPHHGGAVLTSPATDHSVGAASQSLAGFLFGPAIGHSQTARGRQLSTGSSSTQGGAGQTAFGPSRGALALPGAAAGASGRSGSRSSASHPSASGRSASGALPKRPAGPAVTLHAPRATSHPGKGQQLGQALANGAGAVPGVTDHGMQFVGGTLGGVSIGAGALASGVSGLGGSAVSGVGNTVNQTAGNALSGGSGTGGSGTGDSTGGSGTSDSTGGGGSTPDLIGGASQPVTSAAQTLGAAVGSLGGLG